MYFRLKVPLEMVRPGWIRVPAVLFIYGCAFIPLVVLASFGGAWDSAVLWFTSLLTNLIGSEE